MTKIQAIKKLENFLNNQNILSWKYSGPDYQSEIMAAEDALECLLGNPSIRSLDQAFAIAKGQS